MISCPDVDMFAVCDASEIPIYTSADLDTFLMEGGSVGDNCLLDSLSLTLISETTDSMMCPETVTRTYLISDASGNTATCQQRILVNDTIAPVLSCPAPEAAVCDISEVAPYADYAEFIAAGGLGV